MSTPCVETARRSASVDGKRLHASLRRDRRRGHAVWSLQALWRKRTAACRLKIASRIASRCAETILTPRNRYTFRWPSVCSRAAGSGFCSVLFLVATRSGPVPECVSAQCGAKRSTSNSARTSRVSDLTIKRKVQFRPFTPCSMKNAPCNSLHGALCNEESKNIEN